jgi:hypothetical protein
MVVGPDPALAAHASGRPHRGAAHGFAGCLAPAAVGAEDVEAVWQGVAVNVVLALGQRIRPVSTRSAIGGAVGRTRAGAVALALGDCRGPAPAAACGRGKRTESRQVV